MAVDRRQNYRKRHRVPQLRALCEAARLGSLAQAAQRLGLSPQAASIHVRELEHELDAKLFERGRGGVTLTSAGERLLALAGPLVDGMERLFEDFGERVEDDVRGWLDLAASAAGAAIVLPRYVRRFRERYPGVRVRVRSCALGEGMALLGAGKVELVLGAREPLDDDELEYRKMLSYDIVLITWRDHPLADREMVTLEEAAQWPAIVPATGSYSRRFGEAAARECGVDVKAVLEVGGWGVIKRYVERGIGICVVPSLCLHETDQVSVIGLAEHVRPRSFGVYTRRRKTLSAPARAFLGLLIPGFAQWRRGRATLAGEAFTTRMRGRR